MTLDPLSHHFHEEESRHQMSGNPHGYEPGFTIEKHRDELIDRLGEAIRRIAALEAELRMSAKQSTIITQMANEGYVLHETAGDPSPDAVYVSSEDGKRSSEFIEPTETNPTLTFVRSVKYEALKTTVERLTVEKDTFIYDLSRLQDVNSRLMDQNARLDWQPITPENLPKVGDEVLSGEDGEVTVNSVHPPFMIEQYRYQGCINTGWTHFRPINPPILAARTTPPAPEQPSICPDCRSAKPSSRGLLCDAGREWRCDNEWHKQPAKKEPE